MKKLLTLLMLSTILFACGSSDSPNNGGGGDNGNGTPTQLGKTTNPIPASEWKGESPSGTVFSIDGDWILTHENGSATNQFLVYEFGGKLWYNLKKKPNEGETPNFINWVSYTCNTNQIKEDKTGLIYTYKTSSDLSTMTLFDGSNTWAFKKYDNNGVWKWNGDWNDPKSSPYYAVYNGNYNPVKGVWRLVAYSLDNSSKYDNYCWFKDYRSLYTKNKIEESNYTFISDYEINDDGLYYTSTRYGGLDKYWINRDTLYIQKVQTNPVELKGINKYVKIQ